MSLSKKYIILGEIGRGSMAVVGKAVQKSLERVVAIKQIHPHLTTDSQYVLRFEREAKAAGSLKHVNIMDIIDFGHDGNDYYIVSEYIDGPSLYDILQKTKRLPLGVILSVAVQLLNGLEHSHNKGVIHRDIKPENIMFTRSGVLKITDFGVAQATDLPSLTQIGQRIIGTPQYMSPEQAQGGKIDQRSDLFSVGVILYQMLTDTIPFQDDSVILVFKRLVDEPHPPIRTVNPEVPVRLARIVDKALEKDMTKRYFDSAEFVYALEMLAFEAGIKFGMSEVKNLIETAHPQQEDDLLPDKPTAAQIKRMKPSTSIARKRTTAVVLPLTGCSGCQVNLLDLHENITKLNQLIQFTHTPFMDAKQIPNADIGLVEGCVGTSEDEKRLKILRDRCETLVALGTCACFGGIPGLRNLHPMETITERVYREAESNDKNGTPPPSDLIPPLNAHVRPVPEVVHVDGMIPGCPSPHFMVLQTLEGIVNGTEPVFPTQNLCFECKRKRKEILTGKKEYITEEIRPLMELPSLDVDTCFLEQGVLCVGMTTRAGCGARCIANNIPCLGCMGPPPRVKETGAKWIDAMATLLPGGALRFRHDPVGLAYCYTLPLSMIPYKKS